jgi:hypothetical protein
MFLGYCASYSTATIYGTNNVTSHAIILLLF